MRRAASGLERSWYTRGPTPMSALLAPLAWLFGGVVALRRAGYRAGFLRRSRLPVPVVVVGNITVGGSGKTPLVIALVLALAARGHRPGILSRGHGRRTRDTREAHPDDDAGDVGDEPLLLAGTGVPVFVGRDRVAAGRALIAAHPDVDVLVTDDGLQHYALDRDVEIAVIDSSRRLGNGRLLPSGPLREPASRLDSVDALVWRVSLDQAPAHRGHPHEYVATSVAGPWVNLCDPARRFDARALADPSTVAIAGIAHPSSFFAALRSDGFQGRTHAFADHHGYRPEEIDFPGAAAILMTEKDAVKCRRFADPRMWMRPIRTRIEPALVDFVLEKIDGPEAPRDARLPRHEGSPHS